MNIDQEQPFRHPIKEVEMFANRSSKSLVVLLVLAVVLVSASFVTRPENVTVTGKQSAAVLSKSETYLPLPPGKQTQLYNAERAAKGARNLYHRDANWKPVAGMCICPVCTASVRRISASTAGAVLPIRLAALTRITSIDPSYFL